MKSLKPDNNKNCINIGSDVYVLEKEGSYRKRCATNYLDSNKEPTISAHNYRCFYEAVFKSVNMENVLIYRFGFLNENFNIDFDKIVSCVREARLDDFGDFFSQPHNTLIIEQYEDISPVLVKELFDKTPNIDIEDIDGFIENNTFGFEKELFVCE